MSAGLKLRGNSPAPISWVLGLQGHTWLSHYVAQASLQLTGTISAIQVLVWKCVPPPTTHVLYFTFILLSEYNCFIQMHVYVQSICLVPTGIRRWHDILRSYRRHHVGAENQTWNQISSLTHVVPVFLGGREAETGSFQVAMVVTGLSLYRPDRMVFASCVGLRCVPPNPAFSCFWNDPLVTYLERPHHTSDVIYIFPALLF